MKKLTIAASLLFIALITANAQTLKDAIRLTDNEQLEKAASAYKALIQGQPNNGDNYFYFGENYFKAGDLDSAKIMYDAGSKVNATNPLCHVGLGKIGWNRNNTKEAKSEFFAALTAISDKNKSSSLTPQQKAVVYMKIAEVYIQSPIKDLPEAMKLLGQAQNLDARNPEVFLLIGDNYLEQATSTSGNSAIDNYKQAFKLDTNSAKAKLRMGQLYGRARNYQEALKQYQEALKKEPGFAPAYREIAELYYKAGQYGSAISNYKKYLELNSGSCSARVRYASFLYLAKKYEDAVNEINEIRKSCPDVNLLNRLLAYCYYEMGNKDNFPAGLKAIEDFLKKAPADKILASDYEYYGKLLSKTGNDSLAAIKLKDAISKDSTKYDLYFELAFIYIKTKKYDDAIYWLNKKINSGAEVSVNDYNYLGRSYYSLGATRREKKDDKGAVESFTKADTSYGMVIKLKPELPLGYFWKARVLSNLDPDNKKFLARPWYEQYAKMIKPEDREKNKRDLEEAFSYLGFYYFVQKEYGASKFCWQQVKDMAASKDGVTKAEKALNDPNVKAAQPKDILQK